MCKNIVSGLCVIERHITNLLINSKIYTTLGYIVSQILLNLEHVSQDVTNYKMFYQEASLNWLLINCFTLLGVG